MQDATRDIFADWTIPWFLTITTIVTAVIYTRGWWKIRKTRPVQFPEWRLFSFLAGLSVLWLSIGSPMDGFADALLSAHMVEHLLLMSFVPPLVLLGLPVVPMLRGLPRWFLRGVVGPLIRRRSLRRLGHWLTQPMVAWILMNAVFLGWHVPRAYDFALENEHWHDFEHICFLSTSMLFWWPLIRPWPMRDTGLGWFMLPYLMLADIVNTMLSAFLAFCERPVYAYYVEHPNGFGIAPLADQKLGAVVMWVIGSLVFLAPVVMITLKLLQQRQPAGVSRV